MLAQRLLSALVLMPLVLVLVWWSYWAVVAGVTAAAVVGLIELYRVFARGGYRPRFWSGLGVVCMLCLAVAVRQRQPAVDPLPLALMLAITISLVAELPRHNEREQVLPSWALTLAGALYVGWLFSHFIMLRSLNTPLYASPFSALHPAPGTAWVYFVFGITWLQDTAAYVVGKSLGHHKMAPVLSPQKTWEGAIGGLIGSITASIICKLLFGLPISIPTSVFLGLVGGIVGPLGDLAESLLKRLVGLKDISDLIPGHGGLLDRVDSLLFTAPVLFYLIRFFTEACL